MGVSTVFLLLLIYSAGNAWAKVIPRRETVIGTRLEGLAGFFHFLNPGPFGIKEVRSSTISYKPWSLMSVARHCFSCRINRGWRKLCRTELCGPEGK